MNNQVRIFLKASKNLFLLLVLLIFINYIYAQDLHEADSIYQQMLKNPSDTSLIIELNSVLSNTMFNWPDTTLFYANEGYQISEENGFNYGKGRMLNLRGVCTEFLGDLSGAIDIYNEVVKIASENDFDKLLADAYNNLAIVYETQGAIDIAVDYSHQMLSIVEALNDSTRMGVGYNNLGNRYLNLKQVSKGIHYFDKAMDINTSIGRFDRVATNLSNLGRAYSFRENHDSAIIYYKKAYQLKLGNINRGGDFHTTVLGLGWEYLHIDNVDSAEKYKDLAFEIAVKSNNQSNIAYSYYMSSKLELQKNDLQESIKHGTKSLDMAQKYGLTDLRYATYYLLAEAYNKIGNFKEAYRLAILHTQLEDTIINAEKYSEINSLELKFQAKKQAYKDSLAREVELQEIELINRAQLATEKNKRNIFIFLGLGILLVAIGLWSRVILLRRSKAVIQVEKDRSDELLLNILPSEVAKELKESGQAKARQFDNVTILFTDFENFTTISEKLSPKELLDEINSRFKTFDNIITKYRLEKIKTIGDAYMAAGGLSDSKDSSITDVVQTAFEMQEFISKSNMDGSRTEQPLFGMRVGIHTGPVVAGIVGIKKFQYDIWGDTVNIASRMESSGKVGKVNISQTTYNLIKNEKDLVFDFRGKIKVKNKGEIDMYFVSRKT